MLVIVHINIDLRTKKKYIKQTHMKNFRVREGVREGGFGARILFAGVIFPSKIQCIKSFRGGGLRV